MTEKSGKPPNEYTDKNVVKRLYQIGENHNNLGYYGYCVRQQLKKKEMAKVAWVLREKSAQVM